MNRAFFAGLAEKKRNEKAENRINNKPSNEQTPNTRSVLNSTVLFVITFFCLGSLHIGNLCVLLVHFGRFFSISCCCRCVPSVIGITEIHFTVKSLFIWAHDLHFLFFHLMNDLASKYGKN